MAERGSSGDGERERGEVEQLTSKRGALYHADVSIVRSLHGPLAYEPG